MTNQPAHEHKSQAPSSIGCLVITCSDTRTTETDTSGQRIIQSLTDAGHRVIAYFIVKDEPGQILFRVGQGVANDEIQAVIINGGTGISKRDSTFEAVDAMLDKRLAGFGEIFRYLTYREIGSPAIMSRATAGTVKNRVVFSIPGSENAVKLAMEALILPELPHLVQQLTK